MDAIIILLILLTVVGPIAIREFNDDRAKFSKWKANRERCPHGIKGGLLLDRCPKCVEEKQRNEQLRKLQAEVQAKQKHVRNEAINLRESDAKRLRNSIVPTLAELRRLSPQRFEDEMASMFERLGYVVQQTPYVGDYGRDAILQKDGEKLLLECKRYGDISTVGRPEIQKFHSAIISDRAKSGFFVTTNKFTAKAKKHAAKLGITPIDGNELLRYLIKSKQSTFENDQYSSMCSACGEKVMHNLRSPKPVICANGHTVEPTLNFDDLFGSATGAIAHLCARCGAPMKLRTGKNGQFWGCSNYVTTACSYTLNDSEAHGRSRKRRRK